MINRQTVSAYAYAALGLDAAPFEVAAYLGDSPRWTDIPDPYNELPHMAFAHTTGLLVKIPFTIDNLGRQLLVDAIMTIVAEEVLRDPKATDRDRASTVVYLTGLTPPRVHPSPATVHAALQYIRALTRMEPTQAERDEAERRGYPVTLPCYECEAGPFLERGIERPVIGLGGLVNVQADPTMTYRLACGHITIAM